MTASPGSVLQAGEFERLVERHRREIELHCYRMLGSPHDAEDAAQEALLRAWRGRERFERRATFRTWLYRIATNARLRMIERRAAARRVIPEVYGPAAEFEPLGAPASEVMWLEPLPTGPLDDVADPEPGPAARYEAREAIGLAFVAAIHALTPRQRAVVLLRDVVGMSAEETAEALENSVAASNSALQRGRATLRRLYPAEARGLAAEPKAAQQGLLDRYVEAWESSDVDALVRLLASDASWTMPSWREWYVGRAAIGAFLAWAWRGGRRSMLLPTRANGQPAFGYYRRERSDDYWQPFAIQLVGFSGDRVSWIRNFVDRRLFVRFELPESPRSAR